MSAQSSKWLGYFFDTLYVLWDILSLVQSSFMWSFFLSGVCKKLMLVLIFSRWNCFEFLWGADICFFQVENRSRQYCVNPTFLEKCSIWRVRHFPSYVRNHGLYKSMYVIEFLCKKHSGLYKNKSMVLLNTVVPPNSRWIGSSWKASRDRKFAN